jgi:hypothetical protein
MPEDVGQKRRPAPKAIDPITKRQMPQRVLGQRRESHGRIDLQLRELRDRRAVAIGG